MAGDAFKDGETEDYPVQIVPSLVDAPTPGSTGGLWLAPPVPNPGTVGVTLRFTLPREGEVSLEAYDASGRKLRTLVQESRPAGEHVVSWNFRDAAGREVPSGVYLLRLKAGGEEAVQRAIRTR